MPGRRSHLACPRTARPQMATSSCTPWSMVRRAAEAHPLRPKRLRPQQHLAPAYAPPYADIEPAAKVKEAMNGAPTPCCAALALVLCSL